jgi:hypothetical protein
MLGSTQGNVVSFISTKELWTSISCSVFSRRQAPGSLIAECARSSYLVEGFDHGVLVSCIDSTGAVALAQPEDRLHNRELSSGGIETYPDSKNRLRSSSGGIKHTCDCHPVVDDHPRAHNC